MTGRALAAVVLGLSLACASTDPGPTVNALTFPTATFEEVVLAAASAAEALDAAIVEADNPDPERASLTLVCGWRQPTPESPVLRVDVVVIPSGVRVSVAGEVLAGARRPQSTDHDSLEARTACEACPKSMRASEMFVPMSNARAMRNLRAATTAYLAELESQLAGQEVVRS